MCRNPAYHSVDKLLLGLNIENSDGMAASVINQIVRERVKNKATKVAAEKQLADENNIKKYHSCQMGYWQRMGSLQLMTQISFLDSRSIKTSNTPSSEGRHKKEINFQCKCTQSQGNMQKEWT